MRRALHILIGMAALLALAACSTVPPRLQGEYADISPARVEPSAFGQSVRWGGVIVGVRNEADRTCFEILSRDLGTGLRPRLEDRTAGRFMACKPGFYDPEVFAKGREVTLTGRIETIEEHKIEAFDYRYPVLEVDELVLWEERREVIVHHDYPYDPFWFPYYRGGPYWGYYPFHSYYHFPGPYFSGRAVVRRPLPGPVQFDTDEDH
ncbi:Slp family lipoprotein [Elongatibacter sediminis]|uniref:Slp family lipoprotein n=1 Tax=Elongatibacter sediminis TaxID=3119006 RepID=A0AAW9RJY5_9GAMM